MQSEQVENSIGQQNPKQYFEHNCQLMIASLENKVKRSYDEAMVYYVQPALNRSFVIKIFWKVLQHYSQKGQLLGKYTFSDPNMLGYVTFMPDSYTVITICFSPLEQKKEQQILIWSLKDYQIKKYSFERQLQLNWFYCFFIDSKIFCLCQADSIDFRERDKINKIKLSYFEDPFDKPFVTSTFAIPQDLQNGNLKMVKLNNRSTVGIIDKNLFKQGKLFIVVFDLDQRQVRWKIFEIIPQLSIPKICSIKIADVYEVNNQCFYLRIGIQPDKDKLGDKLLEEQSILRQYEQQVSFLWDYKSNTSKRLDFGVQKDYLIQFINNYRQIKLWVSLSPYVNAAREIRRKKMESTDPRDFKYGNEDRFYRAWQRQQIQEKQMRILYLSDSLQVRMAETRKLPIICYRQLPSWVEISSVDYNPKLYVEYFEGESKYSVSIKIRKIKQLSQNLSIIYAAMICDIIDQPDQSLLIQIVDLLVEQEEEGWDYK